MVSKVVPSKPAIEGYIRAAAKKRGIDPDVAVKVAKSEGLNGNPAEAWQSGVVKNGVREPSFGPFQLYMGGGLGNKFQKSTGLDPRDATTVFEQVDFALDHAAKNGWGAWYGAKRVGLDNMAGIGPNAAPRGVSSKAADVSPSLEARDERSIADRIEFADLDSIYSEGGGRQQPSLAIALGIEKPEPAFPPLMPLPELPPPLPLTFNAPPEPEFQNIQPFQRGSPVNGKEPPSAAIESPEVLSSRDIAARRLRVQMAPERMEFRKKLMELRGPSSNIEDRRTNVFRRKNSPAGEAAGDWSMDPYRDAGR